MLVLVVAGCVSRFTFVDTLGRVPTFSSAGGSAPIHVVLAGLDGVGPATYGHNSSVRIVHTRAQETQTHATPLTNVRVVEASSDQSLLRPELPGS